MNNTPDSNRKADVYANRERLSGALKLQRQIDQLQDKLRELRATGGLRGAPISGSAPKGRTLATADLIPEIEGDIERLKEDQRIEAKLIQRQLDKFDLTEREEALLTLRYVECYQWRVVAVRLGVGKSMVHKLENDILGRISL